MYNFPDPSSAINISIYTSNDKGKEAVPSINVTEGENVSVYCAEDVWKEINLTCGNYSSISSELHIQNIRYQETPIECTCTAQQFPCSEPITAEASFNISSRFIPLL